ncbi:UNVERIFIED_CONTAM: hypothetical protein PYX00_000822 [Menopon gallinae]|uniref:GPI ethanolamine phosphate transferase 2 C-terminal domain-containing protein n=1 Tax=Menopon gallinae TaxID=328185 RepID=A0AAW2IBT4_9NEOP
MRTPDSDVKPTFLYCLSVIALFIYLYGFFPIENSFQKNEADLFDRNDNTQHSAHHKLFDKMVLMVIDALRYDFVFPNTSKRFMPFTTTSILNNESCLIKLKAQAPTVTMPRLKAMTSGIVPTYLDVISNFMGTEEFKPDSFIQQAKLNNFRIVFYGDDTWMKLFPKSFVRSEGTNSFFASDYTEVDDNVTRHLDEEFRKKDWDFLIMHYLGLDHIGHMEGPRSVLVGPKLKEMDDIIFKIHQYLKKMEEDGLKSLFIITSDHGMKDSGGHGGVTYPEIILPLVSLGRACNYIPGWPKEYIAEQTDLAPTISTAFGLPSPVQSIGKIIPALLHGMDLKLVLDALEMNEKRLKLKAGILESDMPGVECGTSSELSCLQEKGRQYYLHMSELSDDLRSTSGFNLPCLTLSILLMWMILIVLSFHLLKTLPRPRTVTQYLLLIGTGLYGVSFASTSMIEEEHQTWYFLWSTFCTLSIFESLDRRKFGVSQGFKTALPWVALMFTHRILRKLNQTGDKWAMLPDIKGYLNSSENSFLLTLVFLLGLLALFYCTFSNGCTRYQLIIFSSALIVNLYYRLSISSIHFEFLQFPKSRGKLACNIFWVLTIIFTVQCLKRREFYLAWSLAASILLKPHNVILLSVQVITSRQINKIFYKTEDILYNSIAHFWMGYVFYFYQGNGNSLANVDVSPGFVGLEEFNLLYSGIMVAAHTNSGHILAFLLSPKSNLVNSVLRLFPLATYVTFLIFQLNHLFIWSVFSPKLLYETNFSIIFLILLSVNYLISIPVKSKFHEKPC